MTNVDIMSALSSFRTNFLYIRYIFEVANGTDGRLLLSVRSIHSEQCKLWLLRRALLQEGVPHLRTGFVVSTPQRVSNATSEAAEAPVNCRETEGR
jgi:hypothetical protein